MRSFFKPICLGLVSHPPKPSMLFLFQDHNATTPVCGRWVWNRAALVKRLSPSILLLQERTLPLSVVMRILMSQKQLLTDATQRQRWYSVLCAGSTWFISALSNESRCYRRAHARKDAELMRMSFRINKCLARLRPQVDRILRQTPT